MVASASGRHYTLEDYLGVEEMSGVRHELVDGQIFAMAGGTPDTNPSVIIEVLSPSTEAYDRGEKREHYQQIDALREYVLISQHQRRVEVFRRVDSGWTHDVHDAGSTIDLASLGISLSTDELYDDAGVAAR
jgi:Uma2 family endonuclease